MRKQLLQIFTFLSAFFCVAAVAGFYPVNHGMINQSTLITNYFSNTSFVATQNQVYIHSGASGVWQIDTLPDATHLPLDWWYDIVNNSSSYVTVRDNGGNNIASVNSGEIGHFWSKGNGNNLGSWKFNVQASAAAIAALIPPLPLSIANGGSGQSAKQAAFDALSPTSSKGDLIINNGSNNVVFPVCLNTLQMVADSTQTTGWKCVASAASSGAAAVSATLPLLYNNSTFVMSLPQAATAADGYLGQTDWNTFNGKQAALGFTPLNKASNLSDLASAATARTNLGLGTVATENTAAVLQTQYALADVAAPAARTNLGLGTVATENTGAVLQTAFALADVAAPAARTNLGLGTVATENTAAVLQTAYALADVVASAARTNLGLGALATENVATVGQTTIVSNTLSTCTTARTVDWSAGYSFAITLTSGNACTLSFTNATLGQQVQIVLTNGSGGGTATVVWPTAKWFPAGAPVMTTGTGAVDLCACTYLGFFACNCLQNGG